MANLKGINIALQTPFDAKGSIDFARLPRLLDQYLETGMHGFVLSSGTGQHAYLTEGECNELFRAGVKHINGRAAITAQTSALNLQEVIRRSKTAQDIGVDALMILLSGIHGGKKRMTVDELRKNIETLPPDAYEKMSYYERWVTSITQTMIQRGVITTEELGRKMQEVQGRERDSAA